MNRALSRGSDSKLSSKDSSKPSFDTRFLPSDSIPNYNALLDDNLGRHREFLLGNRKSLRHLQHTGVVEKIEEREDDPNRYVVYMAETSLRRRKRLPSRSKSALPHRSNTSPLLWGKPPTSYLKSLTTSESSSQGDSEGFKMDKNENEDAALPAKSRSRGIQTSNQDTNSPVNPAGSHMSSTPELPKTYKTKSLAQSKSLSLLGRKPNSKFRSKFLANVNKVDPISSGGDQQMSSIRLRNSKNTLHQSHSELPEDEDLDRDDRQRHPPSRKKAPLKTTVEHLLESDASFLNQIQTTKDQLAKVDQTKARIEAEISELRRRVRGVNAVQENDAAVAHCSSVMQHRLAKAEEDYMKKVTVQQQIRQDVDKVRRELLSLDKVRAKLESDIEDVKTVNEGMESRILASKTQRIQLTNDLTELERRAEIIEDERRINLPPAATTVVDVESFINAVQERATNAANATTPASSSDSPSMPNIVAPSKARGLSDASSYLCDETSGLVDARTAFGLIQHTAGYQDVESFVESFLSVEKELLHKHRLNVELQEEVKALQSKFDRLSAEASRRRESATNVYEKCASIERDMFDKLTLVHKRTDEYDELREQRNEEMQKLRQIMQRALEILHAESMLRQQEQISGPMLLSELSSGVMLETLQKKIVEVALTIKMKLGASQLSWDGKPDARSKNAKSHGSSASSGMKQSNIVLGPRAPTGQVLSHIFNSVQPPSVETAQILSQKWLQPRGSPDGRENKCRRHGMISVNGMTMEGVCVRDEKDRGTNEDDGLHVVEDVASLDD